MGTASQKDAKPHDPHIQESTLPVALAKVRAEMPTYRTSLFTTSGARPHPFAALGVDPVVAERCLNHKIKGGGIYNRYQYFDERKAALTLWCDLLVALERGEDYNVTPMKAHNQSENRLSLARRGEKREALPPGSILF
jgi:hypothetical protein